MPSQISTLLGKVESGDTAAASRLLPLVYTELRRLAAHYMRAERAGQTIQPTELVHEAYLRLVGHDRISWQGRSHFLALAATSMRRILIDRARRKLAEKHGGGEEELHLEDLTLFSPNRSEELVALDDALKVLAEVSPRQSRIIEFRFFGGLTVEEIAAIEGISERTVKQDWRVARAWLHKEVAKR